MINDIAEAAEQLKSNIKNNQEGFNTDFIDFAQDYCLSPQLKNQALANNIQYVMESESDGRNVVKTQMLGIVDDIVSEYRNSESWQKHRQDLRTILNTQIALQKTLAHQHAEPVFSCEHLGVKFKSGFQLQDVDLELYRGEITAVVGENGNGKTTLFRILVGELKQDTGRLTYHFVSKDPIDSATGWAKAKRQIAYVPQELPKWHGGLRENLEYEAAIHGIKGEENKRQVDFIIERLGLGDYINLKWRQLSGGYKLRFALAKALVWKPSLLVIDEPLANLDIRAQQIVLKDLRDLANSTRHPLAVMVSSQHLHEIEAISDKLLFLRKGKVLFNDKTDKVGHDRDYNLFEVGCHLRRQEFVSLFPADMHLNIHHNGLFYVIQAPMRIQAKDVLQELMNAGVEFSYFRDLSCSTKRLFH